MRQEALERKRREDRRRILQSDVVLNTPYSFPSLYNIYGTRYIGHQGGSTPMTYSRQGSYPNITTPGSFLPKISSDSPRSLMTVSETDSPLRLQTPRTPADIRGIKKKKKKKNRTRSKSVSNQKTSSSRSGQSQSHGIGYLPPLSSLRHESP